MSKQWTQCRKSSSYVQIPVIKNDLYYFDVDVVERSQYDMSFKYFLDMSPEEAVINPSSLTKFRKLRLKDTDLLNMLISKTVSVAIEKDIIKSSSIIVDATHSLSRSNPYSALEVLRERSKLLRKAVYSIDEAMKGRMPEKNVSDELEKELVYCSELASCIACDQTKLGPCGQTEVEPLERDR